MASARRSTLYFVTLVVFGGLAAAGWWWWHGPRAEGLAREEAAGHLARLELCWLGEVGLTADEGLARATGSALREAVTQSDWPARCEPHRQSLRGALAEAKLDATAFDAAIPIAWGEDGWRAPLRRALDAARALELPASEAGDVTPPPAPFAAPTLDALPRLEPATERAFEDAPAVSFVLGTPEAETTAAQICALADSGPDLACGAPFRIEGRASLRPLPREAGAPVRVFDLLSAADGTDAGTLRDASGESVSDTLRPALVRPDAVIGWRLQQVGKPLLAVRLRGDAEDTRELDAPFVGAGPVDALMAPGFSAVRWEEPGKRALVLAYPWTGDFPGAPRALEAVGLLRAACTLGDASALVSDEAGAAVVDVWTGVDHARHRVEAAGTRPRCLPGAVSFLDESDGEVTVTRCDAAGCEATQARPAPPWEGPWQTRSIDLGTSLLHVFHGEGLPTFARVGEGALHLLVDAPVGEPLLLPHRGGAVLVFASGDATRAVVIDAEGAGRAPLLSGPSGS